MLAGRVSFCVGVRPKDGLIASNLNINTHCKSGKNVSTSSNSKTYHCPQTTKVNVGENRRNILMVCGFANHVIAIYYKWLHMNRQADGRQVLTHNAAKLEGAALPNFP